MRATRIFVNFIICFMVSPLVVDSVMIDPRYAWPNDSLIGSIVPCSDRERECLQFNRLYHPETGSCYPFLDGPDNCVFVADKTEFLGGTGHLRGKCLRQPPCCTKSEVSISSCQVDEAVKKFLCVKENSMTWSLGLFGNLECRCLPGMECRAKRDEQSAITLQNLAGAVGLGDRRCRVPALWVGGDPLARVLAPTVQGKMPRAPRHLRCIHSGRVWVDSRAACFPLRTQGPCPVGATLVLNKRLWAEGRMVATCAPEFLCRPGLRRLAADGRCHPEAALRAALRPGEGLFLNRFGETFAAFARARRPQPRALDDRLRELRPNCYATQHEKLENSSFIYWGGLF